MPHTPIRLHSVVRLSAAAGVLLGVGAFAQASVVPTVADGDGSDTTPEQLFESRISPAIVQAKCVYCHVAGGASAGTRLVFLPAASANHLARNFETLENFVARVPEGAAQVLAKIAGDAGHGGGEQVALGSEDHAAMQGFLSGLLESAGRLPSQGAAGVGYYNYESPHSNPIAVLPDGSLAYVANTPADTVDVIDTATDAIVARVPVGIDPVAVAVRPDGREVWVSNHVSDSVSVVDTDPNSPTRHQVLATIQDIDAATKSASCRRRRTPPLASPSIWRKARWTCGSTTWGCTKGTAAARRDLRSRLKPRVS